MLFLLIYKHWEWKENMSGWLQGAMTCSAGPADKQHWEAAENRSPLAIKNLVYTFYNSKTHSMRCHTKLCSPTEKGLKSLQKERKGNFGFWLFSPQFCFISPSLHNAGHYLLPFLRTIREPPKSPTGEACLLLLWLFAWMHMQPPPLQSHGVNPFTSSLA